MTQIGIMQGRLLPRYKNRYQAHPLNYWQAEFFIAKELGFNTIEFILDYNDYQQNPLLTTKGIEEIKDLIAQSEVGVKSICADYFMEAPFHSDKQKQSEEVLEILLNNSSQLGVADIVIPCVDQSTLKDSNDMNMFVASISKVLPTAEKLNININFETDLNPSRFKNLLTHFSSDCIKVNYDIGNSASLGYDPIEEFEAYGPYISDLHIKDRVLGGGSVKLGTGNANFDTIFKLLKAHNFKGNIIMQSARELNYVNDLELVQEQKQFIDKKIFEYLG